MNIFEKYLGKDKKVTTPEETMNEIKNEEILKKLKQMAYSEAEIELGTNIQAKAEVEKLGPNDFDYISRVEKLVKDKLENPGWVEDMKKKVMNKNIREPGIKPTDELYKSRHGILESYAQSKDIDKTKRIEELKDDIKNSLN